MATAHQLRPATLLEKSIFLFFEAKGLRWISAMDLLIAVGSCMLLLSSLGRAQRAWERRITASAGLLGLSYVGCSLCWDHYPEFFHSQWFATSFYVIWHALDGIFLAVSLSMVFPKGLKVLLRVSFTFFATVSLVSFVLYKTFFATCLLPLCLAAGLLIGTVFLYAVFPLFEKADKPALQASS